MDRGMGSVLAKDVAEDKSGPVEGRASARDTSIVQTRSKSGLDPDKPVYAAGDKNECSMNIPGNPKDPVVFETLASEWRSTMMTKGIQGEFQTIGVPGLQPGEMIQVSGFAPVGQPASDKYVFDGPYGVINVRHSAGVGGFTTNFMAIMNFFPDEFKQAAVKTKGDLVPDEDLPVGKDAGKGDRQNVRPR